MRKYIKSGKYTKRAPKYSDEYLIQFLKDKANELGRTPTMKWWYRERIIPGATTYRARFGTWNNALKAAGLYINLPWTPEEVVIQDIIKVANELGRPPKRHEYIKLGKFKPWNKEWNVLLEKAGLKKNRGATRLNIVDAIVAVSKDIGITPTAAEFHNHYLGYSATVVYKHFHSFDEALSESGLPPRETRFAGWTKSTVLSALLDFYGQNSRAPISRDLENPDNKLPPLKAITRFYKSFRKARKLAGIPEPNKAPFDLRLECNDGHIASSRAELEVDNFLSDNRIPHETQVYVSENRDWTCDFVVGNLWIEVDGLMGSRREKPVISFHEKLNFYSENKMTFLVIHPYVDGWQDKLLRAIRLLS